ncbi:MAG: hypothetical protein ACRD6W_18495 [Nitrososphaerales archaeon]
MSAMINRNLVTQVNQDSGSLTSATTVVHRFTERGEYKGVLFGAHGTAVGEFAISVGGGREKEERMDPSEGHAQWREDAPEERSRLPPLPMKVEIDLTSLSGDASSANSAPGGCEGCGDEGQGGAFTVTSGGYAVFKVPAGAAGGYAVELYKSGESGRGDKVFDSRALGRSDLLAVVLLRPGAYSVTNASNGTKAELRVAYPEKIPRLLEPVKVTCAVGAVSPAAIKVQPTQGLVFSFETPSRVKIELVTPDDRPKPKVPVASPSGAGAAAKKHSRRLQLAPRRPARN